MTGRTLDTWHPTVAHLRAVLGSLVLAGAAVLGGRPDLLVIATPLVAVGVWSSIVRPRVAPTLEVALDHVTVREGEATTWHARLVDDEGRVEDVSVMLAPTAEVDLRPDDGETAISMGDDDPSGLDVLVRPRRWGRHRIGPPTVVASGAWAAHRWASASTRDTRTLVALPRAERFDASTAPVHTPGLVGGNRSPREGAGTEFATLRPFRPGDRLRRIHWPRSSRSGELYVTTTWADHDRRLVLMIDGFEDIGGSGGVDGRASSLDIAVRAAAAIAEHATDVGDRVALMVLGSRAVARTPAATGRRHLRRILEMLAAVEPAGSRADDGRVPRGLGGDALVVLLSPLVNEQALQRAVSIAARGIAVVVVDCLPPDLTDGEAGELVAIAWRIELLERADRIRAARDRGVSVVPWRGPGSLDAVVCHVARAGSRTAVGRRA